MHRAQGSPCSPRGDGHLLRSLWRTLGQALSNPLCDHAIVTRHLGSLVFTLIGAHTCVLMARRLGMFMAPFYSLLPKPGSNPENLLQTTG